MGEQVVCPYPDEPREENYPGVSSGFPPEPGLVLECFRDRMCHIDLDNW